MGNSISAIEAYVFYDCSSLTSIVIPNTVTYIGERAFFECASLSLITIGNSVEFIDEYAFRNCISLTSITIPASVTELGTAPFTGCTSMESFFVDPGNTEYSAYGGVLFNFERTSLIHFPPKLATTYTVPEGVTSIGVYSFFKAPITSITLPQSLKYLRARAFRNSRLEIVVIPKSVISVAVRVFYGCSKLKYVGYEGLSNPTHDIECFDEDIQVHVPAAYVDSVFCERPVLKDYVPMTITFTQEFTEAGGKYVKRPQCRIALLTFVYKISS